MDITLVIELVLFWVLMLLSGFFSSSEASLFSLNGLQLEKMRRDDNPKITLIERMLSEPRRLIVTILIGNEFVNLAASVISAAIVIQLMGAEGIVSIEDILEEVVEDIQDEYDSAEPEIQLIRRQDDGTLLANARVDLDDLAEELGVELPKGRYSSLAGFLLEKAGEVPEVGGSVDYKDLSFTVTRGSVRSIQEVKISVLTD